MAILQIKKYPEKILKTKSEKITRIDGKLLKLSKDMLETMYFFNGIGLAANQVGELSSVFVADIKPDGKQKPIILFNPKILSCKGNCYLEEGCLSFPGISAKIKRAEKIVVCGIRPDEKEIKMEVEGILARVFQHEIDHLNGIVFFDRVNFIRRLKLNREYFRKK
ncbi:MAG TPA: peptide deformylase [Elusimicrobia bacterium]|nr:peptide deformylase [Elusimicrobiota bacterium]